MKLKKIASLALAGVMAVSMLAGCATKAPETNNNNGTVVTTGSAAVVEAFNDKQETVKFASDATLQSALEQAVKSVGTKNDFVTSSGKWTGADYVKAYMYNLTGDKYDDDFPTEASENGTKMVAVRYGSTSDSVWSMTAVAAKAADDLKEEVAKYKETTFTDGMKSGSKYYDYTYTGNVAVASFTDGTGATAYYVVYTVTRTATEQTYKK